MKKCPNCNAEMDNDANFCIYCMTSFDEKEAIVFPKIRRINKSCIITVVLAFTVLSVTVLSFVNGGKEAHVDPVSTIGDHEIVITENTASDERATATVTAIVYPTGTEMATSSAKQIKNTVTAQATANTVTPQPTFTPTPQPTYTPLTTVEPLLATDGRVTYQYREALAGEYYSNASNWEEDDSITLTGVTIEQAPLNGVYEIPEYIGSRKVIGVYYNTFYFHKDTSLKIKAIIFPKTIEYIDVPLFGAVNIEDEIALYIKSDNVRIIYPNKWAEYYGNMNLTVYCSPQCRTIEGALLKDIISENGIKWVEWVSEGVSPFQEK